MVENSECKLGEVWNFIPTSKVVCLIFVLELTFWICTVESYIDLWKKMLNSQIFRTGSSFSTNLAYFPSIWTPIWQCSPSSFLILTHSQNFIHQLPEAQVCKPETIGSVMNWTFIQQRKYWLAMQCSWIFHVQDYYCLNKTSSSVYNIPYQFLKGKPIQQLISI